MKARALRWVLLLAVLLALLPGAALATTTITGTAGTTLNAQATAPSPGDFITASSIQTPLTSVLNDLATIKSGTYTTSATVTHNGTETVGGTLQATGAGVITAKSGGSLTVQTSSTFAAFSGSQINLYGQIRIPAGVILADRASITDYVIGAEMGNIVLIKSQSSGFNFVLKITTSPAPVDGDWIRFVCADSAGNTLSFKNEGGTVFAQMVKGTIEVRYNAGTNRWVVASFGAPDGSMTFSSPY